MVEISSQKIFAEIGYCFAWMLTWANEKEQFTEDFRLKQHDEWLARLQGVFSVVMGTDFLVIGELQENFCGYFLPNSIIEELETNKHWPEWFNLELLEKQNVVGN